MGTYHLAAKLNLTFACILYRVICVLYGLMQSCTVISNRDQVIWQAYDGAAQTSNGVYWGRYAGTMDSIQVLTDVQWSPMPTEDECRRIFTHVILLAVDGFSQCCSRYNCCLVTAVVAGNNSCERPE